MSQSRVPVFTTRKREEDHVLPARFYACERRVRDVRAVGEYRRITCSGLTVVDLVRIKDVRDRAETAAEAASIVIRAIGRHPDVSSDREVVDTLVDVGHHVTIE